MYKILIFLGQSEIQDGHHHSAKFRTIWEKNILELFLYETTEPVDSKLSWNTSWMVTVFSFEAGNRCISSAITIKSPAMNFPSMGFNVKK
jgi:hypothetical protein